MCLNVCVCVRERERMGESEINGLKGMNKKEGTDIIVAVKRVSKVVDFF